MRTRLTYLGAWLLGTVVAIAVTTAAVGLVRDEVADTPTVSTIALPDVTGTTAPSTTPTSPEGGSTTSTSGTSSTTTLGTSSTTTTTAPSTTTTSGTSSTTTTTAPSTTTTTAPVIVRSYTLVGGTVTIRASDPTVTLVGATPAAGFTVDVGNGGPNEVSVEFESSDHESEFRAKWEDGELDVDIDESGD